ncbi:hypothetical protein ABEB33_21000 [Herbaspirillum huttiense]|uniref:hypothetical protein n=1 Tax=Herbaspirillum huttiense TaxID=863372 RepID=UPI001F0F3618|nr:hypothetical protein [Herbaspirillum huttiense]
MKFHFQKIISLALLALIPGAVLTGCDSRQPGEKTEMSDRIEIHVNQSPDELSKKYSGRLEVLKHPSGLNFYTIRWRSPAYGNLVIGTGPHSVNLPYVLSAKGNDDSYFPDEKIINWDINAGMATDDLIEHDEARLRFFGILRALRQAGWSRAIGPSEPRLAGKDALTYRKTKASVYSLDPDYVLSLDEWIGLRTRTTWSLFTTDAYMDISITPDPSRLDVNKPGAYFVEYSLQATNEHWRGVVGPNKRLQWQAELPEVLVKLQGIRKIKEEELKKNHIAIDETYRDPPLPVPNH